MTQTIVNAEAIQPGRATYTFLYDTDKLTTELWTSESPARLVSRSVFETAREFYAFLTEVSNTNQCRRP